PHLLPEVRDLLDEGPRDPPPPELRAGPDLRDVREARAGDEGRDPRALPAEESHVHLLPELREPGPVALDRLPGDLLGVPELRGELGEDRLEHLPLLRGVDLPHLEVRVPDARRDPEPDHRE